MQAELLHSTGTGCDTEQLFEWNKQQSSRFLHLHLSTHFSNFIIEKLGQDLTSEFIIDNMTRKHCGLHRLL